MDKLIGFNLIQAVIWFILVMIGTSKTKKYSNFYSNWATLTVLTAVLSLGVYYLFK